MRDGSGLNALKIKKCLSEASFFNLAGRHEPARACHPLVSPQNTLNNHRGGFKKQNRLLLNVRSTTLLDTLHSLGSFFCPHKRMNPSFGDGPHFNHIFQFKVDSLTLTEKDATPHTIELANLHFDEDNQ